MLRQLIKSEMKKIFKVKMNIVLLIIAILGTGAFFGLKYFEYGKGIISIENQQGESLSGLSLLHYVDDIRHQYAGEWSLEKEKKYYQDFKNLYNHYNDKKINQDQMLSFYGEHYQQLIDLYEQNKLTVKAYKDYMEKEGMGSDIDESTEYGNDQELWELSIYYEDNPIINGLIKAYADGYGSDGFAPAQITESVTRLIINRDIEVSPEEQRYVFDILNIDEDDQAQFIDYLKHQVKDIPNMFDSTIPNEMLQNGLDNCLWISCLCIMIMLANVFGTEKQYHMEQLIYPTKATRFQITIAKLIAGTVISFGIMLSTILVCLFISYILLPVHTWNIVPFALGYQTYNILDVFTYQHMFIMSGILSLMSSLVIAGIVLFLSYITKNKFAVIIVMFLYFGSVIFLNTSGYYKMLHPYMMTHIFEYYGRVDSYLFFPNNIVPYRIIAPIIWGVILCVVYTMMILRSKMKSARFLS